jgi:hypothetical protein
MLCHYRSRVDSGLLRRYSRISRGLSRGLVALWDGSRYVSIPPNIKLELDGPSRTV